jgi:hypothetical protein
MTDAPTRTKPPARTAAEPIRAMREELPTDRAVAKNLRGEPIWRKGRRGEGGDDKFYVPAELVPPGFTCEWKRHTVYNQRDPSYDASLAMQGWEPVPAKMFDGYYYPKGSTESAIVVDGMILMIRPTVLCEEARAEDSRKAKAQMINAKKQRGFLPAGTSFEENLQNVDRKFKGVQTQKIADSGTLLQEIPDA